MTKESSTIRLGGFLRILLSEDNFDANQSVWIFSAHFTAYDSLFLVLFIGDIAGDGPLETFEQVWRICRAKLAQLFWLTPSDHFDAGGECLRRVWALL